MKSRSPSPWPCSPSNSPPIQFGKLCKGDLKPPRGFRERRRRIPPGASPVQKGRPRPPAFHRANRASAPYRQPPGRERPERIVLSIPHRPGGSRAGKGAPRRHAGLRTDLPVLQLTDQTARGYVERIAADDYVRWVIEPRGGADPVRTPRCSVTGDIAHRPARDIDGADAVIILI